MAPLAHSSSFRPYFVTDDPPSYFDKMPILDNSNNKSTSPSSSSSSLSATSDHQQTLLIMAQEEEALPPLPSPCKKGVGGRRKLPQDHING
jgi:hypothetical protein